MFAVKAQCLTTVNGFSAAFLIALWILRKLLIAAVCAGNVQFPMIVSGYCTTLKLMPSGLQASVVARC